MKENPKIFGYDADVSIEPMLTRYTGRRFPFQVIISRFNNYERYHWELRLIMSCGISQMTGYEDTLERAIEICETYARNFVVDAEWFRQLPGCPTTQNVSEFHRKENEE